MFERFTRQARAVVVGAQLEARTLGDGAIGTEHLLLSMLSDPGTASGRALARHGLTHDDVGSDVVRRTGGELLDGPALTTLGIDLEAVRERVEEAFGPGSLDRPRGRTPDGHIPFSPRAKKVLELALREALASGAREITDLHVLLGLLREDQGLAATVLRDRDVDPTALREEIRTEPDS
jgi:ATP-dependent Clp protease ATP-binding subunit ClpA